MKKLVFLFVIGFVMALEAKGTCIVGTEKAKYCGNEMLLEGNVVMESPLGKVFADEAIISSSRFDGSLNGNVVIEAFDGARLSCDRADIDYEKGSAYFYGDDAVYENRGQLILRSKKMRLQLSSLDDSKQEIQSIYASGDVRVDREEQWNLLADQAVYQKEKQEIHLSSKEEESQLFFHDYQGKIYADHAVIELESNRCLLQGNVKLIQREGVLEQYAMADRVEISKNEGKMHFFSGKNQHVLFFDRVNGLQVSAPELVVIRDPVTRKENVRGKGNVRFHFKEDEYERMKLIIANRDYE